MDVNEKMILRKLFQLKVLLSDGNTFEQLFSFVMKYTYPDFLQIKPQGQRKVGILGLSFKSGTDYLRCSPIVDVVESLLGEGFEIRIYDKNVKVSELTGTNKDFIMAKIPHLQHFVTDDLEAVCRESDVLVVTNKEAEFADVLGRWPGKTVVDLVRQWKEVDYDGRYEGLSWGDINSNRDGQSSDVKRDFRQTEF